MKKKLIVVFLIFIAIGVGLFYLLTMGDVGVEYDTVQVIKGQGGQSVGDLGRISSKNIRKYYGTGGQTIEQMSLKLGDRVSKGQLLIQYENNHEELDLEIQRVKKQIEALEATYSEAQSGVDMGTVNSSRIEISSLQNQIENATREKERIETLYNEGVVSMVELEQTTQVIDGLNTQLQMAQNSYSQASRGLSRNMREKYEAEIEALLLSIDLLEQSRQDGALYADIEGVVTELNTFEGDKPSAGMMLIELQDPTEKIVLVDFMMEDAIRIDSDMMAQVSDRQLEIYIEELRVDQVYPKAFETVSELGVRENRQTVAIGLPASASDLDFGTQVETMVLVEPPREMLLVPMGAVIQKDGKTYVKVLEDDKPVERQVTTGISVDKYIEITDGVIEGDHVLINYQED
jgi:HlyD family secretion protein